MTNEQILKKAIEKAIKNGWEYRNRDVMEMGVNDIVANHFHFTEPIIFSHDFAKAFFGKEFTKEEEDNIYWTYAKERERGINNTLYPNERWQYHLQQMVLEKEPLQYLKKFL